MHSTLQPTSSSISRDISELVVVNITHVEDLVVNTRATQQDSNSKALQRTVTTGVASSTDLTNDVLPQISGHIDSLVRKTSDLPADGTYAHIAYDMAEVKP